MKLALKRNENSASTIKSRSILTRWNLLVLLLVINDDSAAKGEDCMNLRPNGYKKWRKNPKVYYPETSPEEGGF